MLVVTRKVDERIVCSNGMVITITAINRNSVRIGIEAPPDVTILRSELCETATTKHETKHKHHDHSKPLRRT